MAEAREGADGTEYSTLKERLDSEYNDLELLGSNAAVDISSLKSSKIGLLYPPMALTVNSAPGSCQIMYNSLGHAVLVDMGRYESYTLIKTAMKRAGISAIDHIIISHWHGDHTGINYTGNYTTGYDHWKSDFDMTNTTWWVPPMPESYGTDENEYVNGSFSSGAVNIVTSNGLLFTWCGVDYSVYNASHADIEYHDTNDSNDYNQYSWITYATYNGTRICNTADIGESAMNYAMTNGYVFHSTLMTAPHHGVNQHDSAAFADTVRPAYVYISNTNSSVLNGIRDGALKSISRYSVIVTNTENYPDSVSFEVTTGGLSFSGSPSILSMYAEDNAPTIYVDPTVSDTLFQNGTRSNPYKYLRRAISSSKNFTIIQLLGDTEETAVFMETNGTIVIEGNNHSCGAVTGINNASIHLKNLNIYAGYFTDSRVFLENCNTSSMISATRTFLCASQLATNNDITLLDTVDSVAFIRGVSTPNRTTANSLFTFSHSCASGYFYLANVGASPLIKNYYSYVNFGRLAETTTVLRGIWDAASSPLIVYDNTVKKYAKMLSDGTLQYVSMEDSAIKSKNVTITLPSSVTVNANTKANILTDFDLSNLISNITRIISFDLEWSNGAVAFASNKYVSGDKTITMDVVAIAPVVISTVRLTVWYR